MPMSHVALRNAHPRRQLQYKYSTWHDSRAPALPLPRNLRRTVWESRGEESRLACRGVGVQCRAFPKRVITQHSDRR